MALTIKEINNVYCIKGRCSTNQLATIKAFFFNKLLQEKRVLINLCGLVGDHQEMTDMLYRIKMSLVNPSRLDYFGHTKVKTSGNLRHLQLIPTRNLQAA